MRLRFLVVVLVVVVLCGEEVRRFPYIARKDFFCDCDKNNVSSFAAA